MNVSIRQIHPVFVGEVSGIDISRPLSRDEIAAVEAGMDRYAVLVFHDQKLTDEQQMAFSRNFGPLEDARGGNITRPEDKRLQVGMNDVSNLGKDGRPLDRESRVRLFNLGNMLWHSDSSFRPIPAKYSLLSARVVNPVRGRRSPYVSSPAGGIVGMPMPEGRILLRELTEHATQPGFVYVHRWRPSDFVMWDNRQMMHRVRRYDESQPRDMRRTTVAGDAPTTVQVQAVSSA